jgi:hypothetical protein
MGIKQSESPQNLYTCFKKVISTFYKCLPIERNDNTQASNDLKVNVVEGKDKVVSMLNRSNFGPRRHMAVRVYLQR